MADQVDLLVAELRPERLEVVHQIVEPVGDRRHRALPVAAQVRAEQVAGDAVSGLRSLSSQLISRFRLEPYADRDALPRDLTDILARVRRGTFEVKMEHRRLESTVDRLVTGLLTAALFVGSAMLWCLKAPPTFKGVSVTGALGSLLALWMGYRLVRTIRKSKKQ